nr:hypothetical protein Itr_chr06CG11840 [Ipomoea trifida]
MVVRVMMKLMGNQMIVLRVIMKWMNNPRKRVRSKKQQPAENTTGHTTEQVNNRRIKVRTEMPQRVEIATEPPEEENAEPTVYIPVPAETHDVLTQEEIDFEMALSSFNFDDLTLPNVRLEQANESQGEAYPVEELKMKGKKIKWKKMKQIK